MLALKTMCSYSSCSSNSEEEYGPDSNSENDDPMDDDYDRRKDEMTGRAHWLDDRCLYHEDERRGDRRGPFTRKDCSWCRMDIECYFYRRGDGGTAWTCECGFPIIKCAIHKRYCAHYNAPGTCKECHWREIYKREHTDNV